MTSSEKPMTEKICLTTGATAVINLKTAAAFAHVGANIIIFGPNKNKCIKIANKIKGTSKNPDVNYLKSTLLT